MLKANQMRVGDTVEAYGTNGNPNGWSKITVKGMHIVTAESHPEWFRNVYFLGIRSNQYKLERLILVWWWICGFATAYLVSLIGLFG